MYFTVPMALLVGDTKVLAAVYGPKAGTKKYENPEKACVELLVCAINAACAALLDARIPMKHLAVYTKHLGD
ncbi:hypothetical protein NC651_017084 [Populus alba x Populus x berolinensis]|nr:hypothetical protein NC651_017084 [Populus alba x Populus x berolinensis]